ncbi:MAG: hypothetical protein JWR69_852 [Pedosphaera sp.]|nr:hypothetical protein [Pedosphaera sp.]
MRLKFRHLALIVVSGSMAWMLTACGPSQSASEQSTPVEIHGEPINAAKAPQAPAVEAATKPAQPAPEVTAVAAVAAEVPKTVASKPTEAGGAYPAVGFDKLASYNFDLSDDGPVTNQTAAVDKADEQIPALVRAFNQKKVSIKGFMLPLKVENGVVTEFLIMKDQSMCCYGNVPKITEWVSVKTASKGVKPIMDQPVSIQGTLHVGAMRENGYLVGIYQMDGEKLTEQPGN